MSELVDLDEAKAHLDVEDDAWDLAIGLKLDTAEALVVDYITVAVADLTDSQTTRVRNAILLVLGALWANRGDGSGPAPNPLNETVDQVLYGLRDPTLA